MKRICLIVIALLFGGMAQAQTQVGVSYQQGMFTSPPDAFWTDLQQNAPNQIQIDILKADSTKQWRRDHKMAFAGYGITHTNLGNPERLGYITGLHTNITYWAQQNHTKGLQVSIKTGLAYYTNPFDAQDNRHQVSLGTPILFMIHFGAQYHLPIGKHLAANAGIHFSHWSSGNWSPPNLGVNTLNIGIELQYSLQKSNTLNNKLRQSKTYSRKIIPEIRFAMSKKRYVPLGQNYFPTNITLGISKQISAVKGLMAGIDFFRDPGSITSNNFIFGDTIAKRKYLWRTGVYAGYQLYFGKLSVPMQIGFYTYNPYKNLPSFDYFAYNFTYQKYGLRYTMNSGLFVSVNIKAHLIFSDHIEFGIGWSRK